MARALVLAVAALVALPPSAAAVEGVQLNGWNGDAEAYAQAGCFGGTGTTQQTDDKDYEFPDDPETFGSVLDATATGSCPDDTTAEDPDDVYAGTTTSHMDLTGGTNDAGESVELAASGSVGSSWTQARAYECCLGSSIGQFNVSHHFVVSAPAVAYDIAGSATTQTVAGSDAGDAIAEVVLLRLEPDPPYETVIARAYHHTGFTPQPDTPTVDVDGSLGPGSYELRIRAYCGQVMRAVSSQQCSASADGTLRLGAGALAPVASIDQAPSGPGNPADAVIAFSSSEPDGATFRCSLDNGPEYACTSPETLEDLAPGMHQFRVIAIDDVGNESAPVFAEWEVGAFDCTAFVQVGFARACGGALEETAAGSGVYRTSEKAWVGGFELVPRPGGVLTLDTVERRLLEEGAGVDVMFAGHVVPFDATAIPVGVAAGDLDFNVAGTAEKQIFKLPVSGVLKVEWKESGAAAAVEISVEAEKFTGGFATFDGGGGKFAAQLRNGIGFQVTSAEVKLGELTMKPRNLQTPRTIALKDLLFKYELKDGKHAFEGGLGATFPFGKGDLDLAGRGRFFDGSFAGASLKVAGINKPIPRTPLFLQAVDGSLDFNPSWGFDLGIEATLGPAVEGKKLVKVTGNARGGALASGCTSATDPVSLTLAGDLTPLAESGVGAAKIEGTSCLYATSTALQNKLKADLVFGPAGQDSLLSATGEWTGWISPEGLSMEGSSLVRFPLLPELTGRSIVSTLGVAACAGLGFFEGGVGYKWFSGPPQAFTGCDLAPWQVAPAGASPATDQATTADSNATATAVRLPRGLPFAGFSARGDGGPPALLLRGPRGKRITADGARRSKDVVVVPVPAESRTYVFVRRPAAGRWSVGGDGITGLRSARGLPDHRVKARVRKLKGKPRMRRLAYRIRRIPGQRVQFHEIADGVTRPIGKPTTRRRGRITFKPTRASDRSHVVQATVTQNGLPRDLVTAARFRAPKP